MIIIEFLRIKSIYFVANKRLVSCLLYRRDMKRFCNKMLTVTQWFLILIWEYNTNAFLLNSRVAINEIVNSRHASNTHNNKNTMIWFSKLINNDLIEETEINKQKSAYKITWIYKLQARPIPFKVLVMKENKRHAETKKRWN